MRPCVPVPLYIRSAAFGGPAPLFCIPLVAKDLDALLAQARAARRLEADVVEWRADSYDSLSADSLVHAGRELRAVLDREPILFTLRIHTEGGAKDIRPDLRIECINVLIRSRHIDLVDIELSNGPAIVEQIIKIAHDNATRVIVSFHDFQATPSKEILLGTISAMIRQGADIAKIACMPREPGDVLRMFEVTLAARQAFPAVPLCTMSMGTLGSITRVAGFLYGSDLAFAVGQETSAPGQIPIAEARAITSVLLR